MNGILNGIVGLAHMFYTSSGQRYEMSLSFLSHFRRSGHMISGRLDPFEVTEDAKPVFQVRKPSCSCKVQGRVETNQLIPHRDFDDEGCEYWYVISDCCVLVSGRLGVSTSLVRLRIR